jgi:predicted dehydrogenase
MITGQKNVRLKMPTQTNSSPLRVAFAGAGKVAETHARILRGVPGATLAAICDVDPNKAESLAIRWGVPAWYGSLAEMLAAQKVDTVHVLTTPPAHTKVAIECMEAGSHVLIEKPMAVSAEECRAIGRAAQHHNRVVAVNHTALYAPTPLRLMDVIRSRCLGQVETLVASFNSPLPLTATGLWMLQEPGNIILELGSHTMSGLLQLMGPVQSATVTVTGRVLLNNGVPFYKTWLAALVCERGPVQLHLSYGRDFGDAWIAAIGQDGVAFADMRRDTIRVSQNSRFLPPVDNLLDSARSARQISGDGMRAFFESAQGILGLKPCGDTYSQLMRSSIGDFYDALREGRAPVADLAFGTAVVEACEGIIRASGVETTKSGVEHEQLCA